jgi:circadian clock protein KaiC
MAFGIRGLDSMIGGGLLPGRPYLISGPTGCGKTLLGLQFLMEGIRRGEPVLLVAVDEPPTEILDNVRSFKWDLSKIHTLDANPGLQAFRRLGDVQEIKVLQEVQSMQDIEGRQGKAQAGEDISLQSIYLKLRRQMDVVPFRRILIDSMTSIRHFALRSGEDLQVERTEIQSLLRFLSEKGVTTLLTSLPCPPSLLTPEMVLCRGEISLSRKWAGHSLERWIWIPRMRGTAHDLKMHTFHIGTDGITVRSGELQDFSPSQARSSE